LQLQVVRIEPVVLRLLVAVAVIGQVDVDELLRGEARGLTLGVLTDLPAEDDAGDAAVLAGHLPVGAVHQAAEEKRVLPRQGLEFRGGPLESLAGLIPAGALGANLGDALEQCLLVRRGGDGIDRPRAGNGHVLLPVEIVVDANHGTFPPDCGTPTINDAVYILQTRLVDESS
jgi:hypothetical protein